MISAINEKIHFIEAISPDWTGGASLEIISALYPGWKKHIEDIGMRFSIATTSTDAHIDHELKRLSWILSRINRYTFDFDEYTQGLQRRGVDAFVKMTTDVVKVLGEEHSINPAHIKEVIASIEKIQ